MICHTGLGRMTKRSWIGIRNGRTETGPAFVHLKSTDMVGRTCGEQVQRTQGDQRQFPFGMFHNTKLGR